jgi:hypothetical protein
MPKQIADRISIALLQYITGPVPGPHGPDPPSGGHFHPKRGIPVHADLCRRRRPLAGILQPVRNPAVRRCTRPPVLNNAGDAGGSVLNEAQQVENVRRAFASDPDVAPFADKLEIRPSQDPEAPWRVEGEVDSIAARRKAVTLAREALLGERIEDRVRLERRVRCSDPGLADLVRAALRNEPALADIPVLEPGSRPSAHDRPWLGVMVQDGTIYLGGYVNSLTAKGIAEGLAWETRACSDVKNLINHGPRSQKFDSDLASACRTLIREHPKLGGEPIEVRVEHAEVTLTGRVASDAQRTLAESLCWFVPSIQAVHDELAAAGPDDVGAQ